MQVMISCAKTMSTTSKIKLPEITRPDFLQQAAEIAVHLSQFSVDDLESLLHVNSKIAVENYRRFQEFHSDAAPGLPAILAYTGIVFKKLNAGDFTKEDFEYAQQHLRFTSFLYGLLRPLDAIRPYRLEGDVRLPELGDKTIFAYWRPLLTDYFIKLIKSNGGILCNLASGEMRGLFNWARIEKEVQVVTPEFRVWKNGKIKTIVIYTKMARGEMTRYIIKNRITNPDDLKHFDWEGFEYHEELSEGNKLVFVS